MIAVIMVIMMHSTIGWRLGDAEYCITIVRWI